MNAHPLLIGAADGRPVAITPRMANRHGLIAGATGTGKTITLQTLAQSFSDLGVPVFVPDIKGDFSGIAAPGELSERVRERATEVGLEDLEMHGAPTVFWDVFGEHGHPLRLTVADLGPTLLSRLMNLNETQSGLLQLVFRVADDKGWLLLDLKDLRAMVSWVGEQRQALSRDYGNIAPASIGAIQRNLLNLEAQGAEGFFGEPAVTLEDFLQTDEQGRGVVNILHAERLYRSSPLVYSTLLLWLLSELFEQLPEVGDVDKPRFVMFFDEAHLLFKDAPRSLTDRIEQVVRLIRSKGVGVYFVTQNPLDLPEPVLGQLGNRIQHALRAFTPRDQRAVRSAAQTFRPNPDLNTEQVITELSTGSALVSVLDERGQPTQVERTLIRPPASRMGPLTDAERRSLIQQSPLAGAYDTPVDRESAYQILERQAKAALSEQPVETSTQQAARTRRQGRAPARRGDSLVTATAKSTARAIGTQVGRQIVRGLLGSLTGRRR
ncbi:helicase HerA-like domain-containing protein [Ectothiorhodospira sp. BSL-9]|uniref:helicase HerA-like domain-containing protein n=1 Tax=Ectothiorhodospira sp. BSL-9 TaxID=1442136 RepID=UPI0007B4277B|nr:helicase HerA-like domain-containing protein [Ectothiorhodospira sp. BSL-9]ANB01236.1 ATP-binding protein [Ectothiorhodospira sp. BSL-9]